ncbi:MAG: LysM peptidoglycan-binding domain-containing protein [Nitrospiraceae bacterium]|nr:LysM peptidoglycan-binding domain-containing protein [Nitrospiraceae bacterium]
MPIAFPLPEPVLRQIEEIQSTYSRNFQAGLDRSYQYLPYIHAELARAGLPMDLAWLAMIESQFHPTIKSHAGARGMWQFMRSTARAHNLRVDSYVDERCDWKKATRAATVYLRSLRDRFDGEWPLAVSAYNMGEGGMERAIALAGGERDLWRLIRTSTRMRRETKEFYPKLIATIVVARSPERFGFKRNPRPPVETARVHVKGSYSLSALDKASGLPQGTLHKLNPELILGVTVARGESEIEVPAGAAPQVMAALSRVPQVKLDGVLEADGTYKVKRGDTLSEIARKYHVSLKELMRVNRIRSARHLRTGKRLVIPGYAPTPRTSTSSSSRGSGARLSDLRDGRVYLVKKGDTLGSIAKRNDLALKDLMALNGKTNSNINVGEKLYVAVKTDRTTAPSTTSSTHVVRSGEYPGGIAERYGVRLDDFLEWNKLTRSSTINIGDKLIVRGGVAAPASTSGEKITHTVVKGESASVIANKYGARTSDFLTWNKLTPRSVLRIGQKVVVYTGGKTAASKAAGPKKTTHVVSRGENPTTIARRYGVKISDLFKWNNWSKKTVLQIGQKVTVYKK